MRTRLWFLKLLLILALAFGATWILFTQVVGLNRVTGDSMQPTLQPHDRLLSLRHASVTRDQIVVIQAPDAPAGTFYIKRVIGLPGDTIRVKDDQLYINGHTQKQPYLKASFIRQTLQGWAAANQKQGAAVQFTRDFDLQSNPATHSRRVPAGKYFVLGDNRLVSHDGRAFGFVDRAQITGVVTWRYWPLKQIQRFTP